MDIGLHLGRLNPRLWVELTEEADRLGYESVWVPEHVVVPIASTGSPHRGSDHPPIPTNVPVLEPFAVLAHLAARTSRIRLGTHVYNIGLRHPFLTARGATTVDVVSSGRLLLGIGASWLAEEWEAMGLDFATRGRRVDEAIAVCQKLWTQEVIEHHGEFFDFGPTAFEPKPIQDGGVPVHIGGDGPAALRRAATVGAGWMPMNHGIDDLAPALARMHEMARGQDRSTRIEITLAGPAGNRGDIERFAEAGVTRLIVSPWTRSGEALDGIRRYAAEHLR